MGGSERYVKNVSKELVKLGHDVTWVGMRFSPELRKNEINEDGVRIRRLNVPFNERRLFCFHPKLLSLMNGVDVVQFNSFVSAITGGYISKLKKKPCLGLCHEMFTNLWKKFTDNKIEQIIYPTIEKIIAKNPYVAWIVPCDYTKNTLINLGVRPEIIKKIPHGIDTKLFRPKYGTFKEVFELWDRFVIIYSGRYGFSGTCYSKNQKVLFDAFRKVKVKIPNSVLLLVGSDFEKVSPYIQSLGLELGKDVIYAGKITDEEMPEFYSSGDVFVSSSLCIHPEELVLIKNGDKIKKVSIKEIKKGDYVLSFDLNNKNTEFSKVIDIFTNENEHNYSIIRTVLGNEVKLTDNHIIFIFENNKIIEKKVSELKIGDRLVSPFKFNIEENDIEIDFRNYTGDFKYSPTERDKIIKSKYCNNKPTKPKLKIDNDFAKLMGYYIGDGWVKKNNNSFELRFCFGKKKQECIDETKKILNRFGFKYNIKDRISRVIISVPNYFLAKFFLDEFGSGSRKKHISSFIFSLPKEKRKKFIEGYCFTDGSLDRQKRLNISSVNEKLLDDFALLLISIGKISHKNKSRLQKRRFIKSPDYKGNWAKESLLFSLYFYPEEDKSMVIKKRQKDLIFTLITDIKKEKLKTTWYDLKIEKGNFLVGKNTGVFVHNSEGFGFSILESQACGTPVVAFANGSILEVVDDNHTGLLIKKKKSPYGLAKGIRTLYKYPKVRGRMSSNAIRWAKRFSWKKSAKAHSDLYEDVYCWKKING